MESWERHEKSYRNKEFAALGMNYAAVPLSENAPPQIGDRDICLANLPRALAFIKTQCEFGPVLIHCRSGKDRTGLVMAYYILSELRTTPIEAVEQVLRVRPIAFSAAGWKEFSLSILEELGVALR
jgi:protein-tyrosine phosphatase